MRRESGGENKRLNHTPMKLLCSLLTIFVLANCASSTGPSGQGMPSPASSKYITGIGGGVMADSENEREPFQISVQCRLKSSAPGPLYVVGEFSSPAPGIQLPRTKPQRVDPGSEFMIASSRFAKIQNNKDYHVRIKAYRNPSCKELTDEVTQSVRFAFPEKIQRLFGLEGKVL